MNKYGALAKRHWARTDPDRYAQISDRQAFFASLGQQAAQQIEELAATFAGPDVPGETYLEKVGRLNMATLRAEEVVLADLILIAAPEDLEEQDEPATDVISDVRAAIQRADEEFYQQNG